MSEFIRGITGRVYEGTDDTGNRFILFTEPQMIRGELVQHVDIPWGFRGHDGYVAPDGDAVLIAVRDEGPGGDLVLAEMRPLPRESLPSVSQSSRIIAMDDFLGGHWDLWLNFETLPQDDDPARPANPTAPPTSTTPSPF